MIIRIMATMVEIIATMVAATTTIINKSIDPRAAVGTVALHFNCLAATANNLFCQVNAPAVD